MNYGKLKIILWKTSGMTAWVMVLFTYRLFGTPGQCSACLQPIPAFEMVMRAKEHVYHLDCFACEHCKLRFVKAFDQTFGKKDVWGKRWKIANTLKLRKHSMTQAQWFSLSAQIHTESMSQANRNLHDIMSF